MTIATVVSISGLAWARDADGHLRELRVGDTLQEGETLVTSDNARVELDFGDSLAPTLIEGGQQVVMTPELDADRPVAEEDASVLDEDLEALLAALEDEEGDLLDILDATAAGAGPGSGADGGHSFVRLARIAEDTDPLAFDFSVGQFDGPPEIEGQGFLAEAQEEEPAQEPAEEPPTEEPSTEEPEVVDAIPDAGASAAELFDAQLLEEGGSVSTGTLDFDFGDDGVGGIGFAGMDGASGVVGTETVTYGWDAGSNTLTATGPRGDLFMIQVNPITGEYTLTLLDNVLHAEGADDASTELTYTVIDGNGTPADGVLTVGFHDDGPSISVTATASAAALETSDAALDDSDSVRLDSLFSVDSSAYGADGAGTTSWSYSLGLAENAGTGLTSGGLAITLSQAADGNIVGSTVDGEVFRISLGEDGDGNAIVELSQTAPIDHVDGADDGADVEALLLESGLVTLTGTATIEDGDGDTAEASQTIDLGEWLTFHDDGPSISVTATASAAALETSDAALDDSDSVRLDSLFSVDSSAYGADGAGTTSWSYSLGLAENASTGLTSGGLAITLSQAADGDIVGSTVDGEVFRISLGEDGDGNAIVELSQTAPIDHVDGDDAGADVEALLLESGLVTLTGTATIEDGDGDTAEASQTIDLGEWLTFHDDGPSITSHNLAIANLAGVYEGVYDFNVGADGQAFSASFGEGALIWSGMPEGYELKVNEGASTSTSITYTASSGSSEFFHLTLNADGSYAFELVSPAPVVETEIESLLSSFDKSNFYTSDGKEAYLFTSDVFDGKFSLAVTAYRSGELEDVSLSSTDLGVKSNVVQGHQDEKLRFDVQPVDGGVVSLSSLVFSVSGKGGSSAGDKAILSVYDVNGTLTTYEATLGASDGEFAFDIDPTIDIDYMELSPAGDNSFKIDGVSTSYITQIFPDDYQLDFELSGSDFDGDAAATEFSVFVKTMEDGSYEISGADGDDVVHGTDGDDVIIGGAGNDILYGGLGDDVFKWNFGDQGEESAAATDVVKDFGEGQNVLDIAELLQGMDEGADIASYLHASEQDGNTVLHISSEGNLAVDGADISGADQVIVLEGVGYSSDILQQLMDGGQLQVD